MSAAPVMVRADVTLSSGTVIMHRPMANGAQEAISCSNRFGQMSPAEWDEYCQRIRSMPVRSKVYTEAVAA